MQTQVNLLKGKASFKNLGLKKKTLVLWCGTEETASCTLWEVVFCHTRFINVREEK